MRQILLIVMTLSLVLGCAQTPANMASSVLVNPVVKIKLGDAAAANLWAGLQQCAAANADLPKSCKAGSKTVTIAKTPPSANCHWQCDENCLNKESCAWEVKTGVWNLEYRRLATIEREQPKVCAENWANIFDDPAQYEENSCEAECFQLSAVVSLSKIDAACAMRYLTFWPEGHVAEALFLSGAKIKTMRFSKMRCPLPESPNDLMSPICHSFF